MLKIVIPELELYNERSGEFITLPKQELQLEHSLVSLSKWESRWCKPFLTKDDKTQEETLDYIRAMTITQNVDPELYNRVDQAIVTQIVNYIDAPMTATTFAKSSKKPNGEIVTSELIYYWMIAFNIPFECQKWHLNRLLTLINVCNLMNKPEKKLNKREILARNRELNALRRAQLNTSG